jgi:hypothetical protein
MTDEQKALAWRWLDSHFVGAEAHDYHADNMAAAFVAGLTAMPDAIRETIVNALERHGEAVFQDAQYGDYSDEELQDSNREIAAALEWLGEAETAKSFREPA